MVFRKPKPQIETINNDVSSLTREEKETKIKAINAELEALNSKINELKEDLKRLKK